MRDWKMMVRRQSHPVYWPEHVRDREADVWVMFSLFVSVSLKLFVGGGRVGRPLGKLMCMQLCARSHIRVCACSCSSITAAVTAATSQWLPCDWRPDNLPRSPHQLPCSSRLALSITSPSTHAFCLPPQLYFLIHPSVHYLFLSFHPPLFFLFCLFSSLTPSFGVWVFPAFRRALCAHRAACLRLYGNPEWTRVAQRSVRQTDTDPIRSHALFLS